MYIWPLMSYFSSEQVARIKFNIFLLPVSQQLERRTALLVLELRLQQASEETQR